MRRRMLPLVLRRPYSSVPRRSKIARELDRATPKPQESLSQLQKIAHEEYFRDNTPLFPGTFVALPLRQWPVQPGSLASYAWARVKHALQGTVSILNIKIRSMTSWRTRPRWRAKRGSIAPTAANMYREVMGAFAAGDKAVLQRLCLGPFAKKLCAAVDRRAAAREGIRFDVSPRQGWGWLYPRLMSHQIQQVQDKDVLTEQAVVAVASTQRAERYALGSGETVPGSVRIQDKIEYVVLSRQVSAKTYESTTWRIWGTTAATTLEAHRLEMAAIDKEQAKRAGWDGTAPK